MVTYTSHAHIPRARAMLMTNSLAIFPAIVEYVLNKVECPLLLEPFIVVVLHHWVCLQNYIHPFKNSCIKRYIPKQNDGRRGLS